MQRRASLLNMLCFESIGRELWSFGSLRHPRGEMMSLSVYSPETGLASLLDSAHGCLWGQKSHFSSLVNSLTVSDTSHTPNQCARFKTGENYKMDNGQRLTAPPPSAQHNLCTKRFCSKSSTRCRDPILPPPKLWATRLLPRASLLAL